MIADKVITYWFKRKQYYSERKRDSASVSVSVCSTYVGRDSDVRLGQLEKAMSEMASSEVGSARLPREKDTAKRS